MVSLRCCFMCSSATRLTIPAVISRRRLTFFYRYSSTSVKASEEFRNLMKTTVTDTHVVLNGERYIKDDWTNVTEKVLSQANRNLYRQKHHPLNLVKTQILDFMYKEFPSRTRSPLFSVFENLNPVVTVQQNFDSLLVAEDHPSRKKSDCYYINKDLLLRAHTSAHQIELIRSGLNNFVVVGDVFRRDEIDRTHYPIFHQVEAVRLCGLHDVFKDENVARQLSLFEEGGIGTRTPGKQESHTLDAVMVMKAALQTCLEKLVQHLFGKDAETRWVETFFPFTHPSWELEVKHNDEWLELLGCGIMEQKLLENAGAKDKIGWAFGIGLERLAMKLYHIPDIRLFWSVDTGVLHQFKVDDPYTPIIYKNVSVFPQCINDISFWLPEDSSFSSNDFYDLVRTVGGDLVEQVSLLDEYHHLKKKKWSHSYRIVYRDMNRTLTQKEASKIHKRIEEAVSKDLRVVIR